MAVEIGLRLTYVLLIIGTLAAVIMPLVQAIRSDPKSLVKSLIGVGIIAAVYLIGYAIAGSDVGPNYSEFGVDSGISKVVGGMLNTMYLLMIAALVGILFTEVHKVSR